MANNGVVNIRGKEYKTVALRVAEFREKHPIESGWSITTQLEHCDDKRVVVRAEIRSGGEQSCVVGTGFAEEVRTASQINRTSAVENCETSAIGRALAACGFGGSEYASANEVQNAIHQQNAPNQRVARPEKSSEHELSTANRIASRQGEINECGNLADLEALVDLIQKKDSQEVQEACLPLARKRYSILKTSQNADTEPATAG